MYTEKIAPRLLEAAFLFVAVVSLGSGLLFTSVVGSGSISEMLVNISNQQTLMRLSSLGERRGGRFFCLLVCLLIALLPLFSLAWE